jgi:uncharacterized protein YifN (PemK superfamily)
LRKSLDRSWQNFQTENYFKHAKSWIKCQLARQVAAGKIKLTGSADASPATMMKPQNHDEAPQL